jgi:hypothetical protein
MTGTVATAGPCGATMPKMCKSPPGRRLTLIDILDGLHHVTVLLHDGRRYFTLTIEPDDDARARRIIICRGHQEPRRAA